MESQRKIVSNTSRISDRISPSLITFLNPKSPVAEAYRSLRTNIGYASIDKEIKTIVITSPSVAEGKSSTACNLAISMAQADKKVLLLDCDLRKPRVHQYFSLPNDTGLTDILVNDISLSDTIKDIDYIDNLFVIGSGFVPPNPSEILQSKKMNLLMNSVRDKFDVVIIDTPPVGQLTDAAILGGLSDGVVLCIASGHTNIHLAQRATESLKNVNAKILGVVLTKLDEKSSGAYYYKYYKYDSYYYD